MTTSLKFTCYLTQTHHQLCVFRLSLMVYMLFYKPYIINYISVQVCIVIIYSSFGCIPVITLVSFRWRQLTPSSFSLCATFPLSSRNKWWSAAAVWFCPSSLGRFSTASSDRKPEAICQRSPHSRGGGGRAKCFSDGHKEQFAIVSGHSKWKSRPQLFAFIFGYF